MNRWIDHYNRPTRPEEQQLYNHWLQLSQVDSPHHLIDRFHQLFVEGGDYPEPEIRAALEKIIASEVAEVEFTFVLNRCCYILINRWLLHPRLQGAIPDLVAVFQLQPSTPAYSRLIVRLRELVRVFTQTDQYLLLRRLADMMQQESEVLIRSQPLGSYIRRYPYLYEHCLLGEDSGNDQRCTVRHIKAQAQRQFEIDLSQYITHRIVRSQLGAAPSLPSETAPIRLSEQNSPSEPPEPFIRRLDLSSYVKTKLVQAQAGQQFAPQLVRNPTLLSDRDLHGALKQFVCKVDGQHTQRDLAQHFLTYSSHAPSYRAFKEDLYGYLTSAISSEYGKRQFYDRLYNQLRDTLPQNDDQQPNEFLLLRTCSKLLNFLVVESPQRPNHFVFLDLINNVGTTLAVSLLLKIVLLCHKAKAHLEKRFSILFNHYEACTQESGIGWLIEALETLNVAFATNFGSLNFACFA